MLACPFLRGYSPRQQDLALRDPGHLSRGRCHRCWLCSRPSPCTPEGQGLTRSRGLGAAPGVPGSAGARAEGSALGCGQCGGHEQAPSPPPLRGEWAPHSSPPGPLLASWRPHRHAVLTSLLTTSVTSSRCFRRPGPEPFSKKPKLASSAWGDTGTRMPNAVGRRVSPRRRVLRAAALAAGPADPPER